MKTQFQIKDLFSAGSAAYAAHRPTYPPEVAEFLGRVSPRRRLAWEAGCGSGQLSTLLGDVFARVIATDASANQIAQATRHPKVEYRRAPAEVSGLADKSVDLAVSAQAAHWFDLPAYYAEVKRVAGAGAVIAMVTYNTMDIDRHVGRVLHDFYKNVAGPYWTPERRHVEDAYRSFAFPFDEIEGPQLEIRREWNLADLVGYVETWSATIALKKAQGIAAMEKFRRDLADAWGHAENSRLVRWPLSMRIGYVSKSGATTVS